MEITAQTPSDHVRNSSVTVQHSGKKQMALIIKSLTYWFMREKELL